MKWIVNQIDSLGDISDATGNGMLNRSLERVAFGGCFLMVLFAPFSIAATQSAWLIGMTAWIIRLCRRPRPNMRLSAVGVALIVLFGWSVISSVFSYEPAISIDKLRGVGVFSIFIYVLNVVRTKRAVHVLSFALIAACMVTVAWTPIQKLVGRGVELTRLDTGSPLLTFGVEDGDVIVRANGKRVNSPDDAIANFEGRDSIELEMNRFDWVYHLELNRTKLIGTGSAESQLGILDWKRGRGFRAAGFYGHYATFSEMLQLVGSLAFGLFVAAFMFSAPVRQTIAFAISVAGIAFALLLTVTRASQLAFVVSSAVIVVLGASRKVVFAAAAVSIPAAALGLYVLQQQRQVGFFDKNDGSTQWRQMMWRDGVRLLGENPRHLIVGVGMDSTKKHWMEWGLFDKGWQPMGHFHSTPIQLAVERGLPALLIWLGVLGLYARILWRGLKRHKGSDWRTCGILLGCIGSLVGFFTSGLVHYNLGDQEVAMVFYVLMAFGVGLSTLPSEEDILDRESPLLEPI